MLGFIEQNPDSIGGGGSRRMLMTPQSYMHPLRSRCGYDTYHSVPGIDRLVRLNVFNLALVKF